MRESVTRRTERHEVREFVRTSVREGTSVMHEEVGRTSAAEASERVAFERRLARATPFVAVVRAPFLRFAEFRVVPRGVVGATSARVRGGKAAASYKAGASGNR